MMKVRLGDLRAALRRTARALQEQLDDDVASMHRGFYAPFDMERDHVGTSPPAWYRAPGRPAGEDGDPYRSTDPYAQLGFHPPAGPNDPTASPPDAEGEDSTSEVRDDGKEEEEEAPSAGAA